MQDVREKHDTRLPASDGVDDTAACDRLCELNVIEQAVNICQTTVVQDAWSKGQDLTVHSWIYGLKDGHLHDLHFTVTGPRETARAYEAALASLTGGSGAGTEPDPGGTEKA